MSISIKKFDKSMVEIEGEISAEDFERHYKDALKELNEKSSIPGFRPGHVPENIVIEKIGEGAVLEQAAERALREKYPKMLQELQIAAIGHPQITITKIARKNPLGFKIKTAVLPEIKLSDYKNIASTIMAKKVEEKVEEKEVEQALDFLRKSKSSQSRASSLRDRQNTNPKSPTGDSGSPLPDSESQTPNTRAELSTGQANDKKIENKETENDELPQINDDFAKKFGHPNLNSLKTLLKDNILQDKKGKAREKKRMEIIDKISESADMEIPQILVDSEKEKMLAELRSSIGNMGMKWGDYLNHIKKTDEELKKGWNEEAEKRSRYALILREIASTENIEPLDEELNDFAEKAAAQYPETERAKLDIRGLKDYAYGILRNEKVFQFLESQQ